MSIQENCRVVENTRLGEGLYLMVLDAPEIVKLTQCGQFVHIACGEGHLLRRPISICTWQGSHLRIVFQVKGDGTKWLSERRVGDVLDVLGPLGHGFDVQALGDRPIFIGGGIVERPGFLALLRQHLAWFGIADYLDTVSHGNDAGLIGAVYHFNQHYRSPGDDRH